MMVHLEVSEVNMATRYFMDQRLSVFHSKMAVYMFECSGYFYEDLKQAKEY